MAMQIPYEDVLTAATQISECTTNLMSVRMFYLIIKTSILNNDIGYQWTITTTNKCT
jgi:hypothetical protein